MVRAPCCEKIGLKRGPWTHEEDRILIHYISVYGHNNWRALPKQAGLLRCGKSCRLRWTNYLRPDIKRGNFSKEEEETIGKLHEILGNRWSAIAARLPGRTDNEIKNVWHTHLKKKLNNKQNQQETKPPPPPLQSIQIQGHHDQLRDEEEPQPMNNYPCGVKREEGPQHSASTDTSSSTTTTASSFTSFTNAATAEAVCMNDDGWMNNFREMDENFWAEVFSSENWGVMGDFQVSPLQLGGDDFYWYDSDMQQHDGMDFWSNLFSTAAEIPQHPVGF